MTAPQLLAPAAALRLAETFAHFLWQGCAIVLLLALAWPALRHASAAVRYRVLVFALLLTAAAPIATFSLLKDNENPAAAGATSRRPASPAPLEIKGILPKSPAVDRGTSGGGVPTQPPAVAGQPPLFERFIPPVLCAYVLGVFGMLARLVWSLGAGQRLRRRSKPVDDPALLAAMRRRAADLKLSFLPALLWCREIAVPAVVGVIRPAILLPIAIASELSPQQVEAILAHELAHLRRCDHLVLLLQRLIEAFLFFHPAVWVLSRRIDIERENCCDDSAVARTGNAIRYAETLLRIAELTCGRTHPGVSLAMTGKPSQLRRRVSRLLGQRNAERFCVTRRGLVALVAMAGGLALSAAQLRGRTDGAAGSQPATNPAHPATLPATTRGAAPELETERGKLRLIRQLLKVESDLLKEEKANLAEARLHAPYSPDEIARVDPVARQKLEAVSLLEVHKQELKLQFGSNSQRVRQAEASLNVCETDLTKYVRKFNEDFAIHWAPDRTTGTLIPLREPADLEWRVRDLQRLLAAQTERVKQFEAKLPAQQVDGKSVPELKAVELRITELRRREIELLAEESEIEQLLAQWRSKPGQPVFVRYTPEEIARVDPQMLAKVNARNEATLQVQELELNYGPNHPQVKQAKASLALRQRDIDEYVQRFGERYFIAGRRYAPRRVPNDPKSLQALAEGYRIEALQLEQQVRNLTDHPELLLNEKLESE